MKFFTVLLFASLATASLAVLPGSEDELHMKTQHTSSTSQSIPTSHNSKESISSKDSSKDSSIFREQLVSKDNVVIECTKSKSQKAQAGLNSGTSQLEETTGPTTLAETTTEGKLTKLNQAIEKNLDKIIRKFMNGVEDIIPGANDITGP
ncbi:glycosylation-dependent cell adhesion molecule 1-like [Peromyscus californicus insignis]|uniref:glycosylation-dependent cell adhesion molecule 1-like n=1 Tax=Peromyscus californicus insignis TaxID=564181 RepID=UPI0022A677D6|nr:glycosylation-dependent cell adhesion molecule 1-like [Peromyscus californicus insignis]